MQADSGAPWIGTLDDPAGFLAERGWHPTLMPDMPHNWFVFARKEP
jgi:hypothetical protein